MLIFCFSLSSCGTLPKKTKKIDKVLQQNYHIIVSVMPFTEKRIKTNKYGSVYSYLIPLVPYGTIRYERPEDARMFNRPEEAQMFNNVIDMPRSLTEAVYNELSKAKIFDTVTFSQEPEKTDCDLIFSGDVNSTLYEGKTYSYGISFLGPVLWSIGLPAGSSINKLSLTFYLKKRDTNEVIWSYKLNKEKSTVQGLYYNWGKEVNSYDDILKAGLTEMIEDMRNKLSKIPQNQLKAAKIPEPQVKETQPQESAIPQPKEDIVPTTPEAQTIQAIQTSAITSEQKQ